MGLFNKKIKKLEEDVRVLNMKVALTGPEIDRIDRLLERLVKVETYNGRLAKNLNRLERIIKYSKDDKPTYYLDKNIKKYAYDADHQEIEDEWKYTLYIYLKKEEYEFKIDELNGDHTYAQDGNISYDTSGLVYLSLKDIEINRVYELILDTNNGKYICTTTKH